MAEKKLLRILSRPMKHSRHILMIFITLIPCLFAYIYFMPAHAEDYTAFARAQAQREQQLIAPYLAEVAALKQSIMSRQNKPGIKRFKITLLKNNRKSTLEKPIQNSKVIIFASFSMPKESLKGWMAQAKVIDAPIYMRGLLNNSLKSMAQAVGDLVKEQAGGILIDPPLFKKYGITKVPAVVVIYDDDFDVIHGDVTLDYALRKIIEDKPDAAIIDAIKKLHGGAA